MIAFIDGILKYTTPGIAVVDCNGIGYEVGIPLSDNDRLPSLGSRVVLHTMLSVSENSGVNLYGFLSRDDLEMFKLLITVNGIGPKAAQGILSSLDADTIRFAILSEDDKTIAKAQGVGKKTAQKIVLELKDKISLTDAFDKKIENTKIETAASAEIGTAKEDAVLALIALGFSRTESMRAVQQVEIDENSTADTILGDSLKFLI